MTQNDQKGPFEQIGESVAGPVGKMMGRANDMALNAVGSFFGTALQQLGGWWATPDAEKAASSFTEDEDRTFRQHHESSPPGGTGSTGGARDYDSARTAYRLGHLAGQNPEYQSKPFDQVEAEVERAWTALGREGTSWSEVRDQVKYGYTYRTPGAPNPT